MYSRDTADYRTSSAADTRRAALDRRDEAGKTPWQMRLELGLWTLSPNGEVIYRQFGKRLTAPTIHDQGFETFNKSVTPT